MYSIKLNKYAYLDRISENNYFHLTLFLSA